MCAVTQSSRVGVQNVWFPGGGYLNVRDDEQRCGWCGDLLRDSGPSEYWCRQAHQELWTEQRAHLLPNRTIY